MDTFESELMAVTDDAIIVTDASGVVGYYNRSAEKMFGYSREQAIGATLDLIIPERLRERHWDGFHRAVADGTSSYAGRLLAVPALRADGSQISVEFTVAFLRDDVGAVRGVGAIVRDVTARWTHEKALRARVRELEQ
jgi:PAS domain S-box-containing protein